MYAPSYDRHPRCRRKGSEILHLADNIKYLREQDGLTQREFAERFEVSCAAVGNWESGTREPELSRIIKMAEFFSVTLDDFILTELRPPAPIYAQNIKHLRKKHEMTQEDMANLLGYRGKQGYNAIETGKAKATVENLEKISDYFGVTLDQLVKKDLSKGAE
jgi:transcriptional regulator